MISFAQHLFEAEFKKLFNSSNYVHAKSVDGHNLQVMMGDRGEGSYEAMVTVNNKYDVGHSGVPKESRAKVAHAARSAVDHFIRHVKPKEISFEAHDDDDAEADRKADAYGSMASHLAKKHSGTHQEIHGQHVLTFNHHEG